MATTDHTLLITGGAGFIGTAASAGLADRFGRVVALDALIPQVHARQARPAALDPRVELVVGDVRDPGVWDGLLEGFRPDVVLHLAAETGTGQSLAESTLHTSTNVVGTSQMLDAFVRHQAIPGRLILASSRAVYGEGAWRRTDGTLPAATAPAAGDRGTVPVARSSVPAGGDTTTLATDTTDGTSGCANEPIFFPQGREVKTPATAATDRASGCANEPIFYPAQRTPAQLAAHQWDFPGAEPLPMRADTVAPHPASVYAVTKLTQEMLLATWASAYDTRLAVVRLQNVYGPGQSLSNPYTGIMSLFCRLARQGRTIPVYEDGAIRRDFILIDDVVDALLAVVDTPSSDGTIGETLDIGTGEHQTILRAAQEIAHLYGAPDPVVTGQYRLGDVRHAWADPSRTYEVLGWTARWTLAEGVKRLIDWIEAQGDVPAA